MSAVGPVMVPTWLLNGATMARSFGRRLAASRSDTRRTKSMRRVMLWLLSTRITMSLSTFSRAIRSIVWSTSSSVTAKDAEGRSVTKRPVLSKTHVSTRTPVISLFSTTSKGGRTTVSFSVTPVESAVWTVISRRSNGFSSSHSTT